MAITANPITNGKEREYRGLSTDTKPTVNVGLNSLFLELDTGDFYYWSGSAWAKIGTAAALTDLSGTTWEIAEVLAPLPYPALLALLNFTSNNASWDAALLDGDEGMILYKYGDGDPVEVYVAGEWANDNYRTVAITGGSGATNADLIAWFEANATRVA